MRKVGEILASPAPSRMRRSEPAAISGGLRLSSKPAATASGWTLATHPFSKDTGAPVSGTDGSNPSSSSGRTPTRTGEVPVGSRGCPLLGSRGDREDQAQRPDKTVGTKLGRDKNGG